MAILYISLGFIIGFYTLKLYLKYNVKGVKKDTKLKKYSRRGLYEKSFETSQYSIKTGTIDVQYEVGEIEKTSSRSKIEVISLHSSKSSYNSGEDKKRLIEMVNNSWAESSEIEWIEDDIQKVREDKLNEILKK